MAGTVDVTYSDLENRFGANLCRQVFCDDGSGQPGPRLDEALSSGRRLADAVLLKAWSRAQIEVLVAEDAAVRAAVLDIVMSEGMMGRIEWEGAEGPRERYRKQGIETLRLLMAGTTGSVGEAKAGANPHSRVGLVTTQQTPHAFALAPSKHRPLRGGF